MGRTRPGGTTGRKVSNTDTKSPFAGTVINVKDRGAVGDGSADDTKALRDAIAASKKGDGIYFPPGTYVIKESLVPKAQQVYFSLTDAAIIKAKPRPANRLRCSTSSGAARGVSPPDTRSVEA